jgi:hypothetical protein
MKEDRLLIFPKWDIKLKYLSIFILCSLLRRIIPLMIELLPIAQIENEEDEDTIINKSYFDLLSNFIADFSTIIIILINKLMNLRGNDFEVTTKAGQLTIKNMKKMFFLLMSLIAIIDIIAQLCLFIPSFSDKRIVPIDGDNLYFVVCIDIISRYFFSSCILKGHFYRHQMLAIIITLIGFIPFIIYNIYKIIDDHLDIIYLLLYIFMTLLYSLEDVLNKICLNKLIISPFELMFYKALFQIIFVVAITIYMIIYRDLFGYIEKNMEGLEILGRLIYRLSFIISNIFRTWSLITIINLANPNYLSILKSSEFAILFLALTVFDNITKEELDVYIIAFGIFCVIFSLIGSSIHNEMIIINKCGLLECTDYYKTEVKSFSNIEEGITEKEKNEDTENSILNSSVGE